MIFQNLTLLYIEPDDQVRKEISRFLHENGLNVIETENVTNGYNLFIKHNIDIILIDLTDDDGLKFIQYLRNKEIMTPIIITSSNTEKDILLAIINLDIARFLAKPFQKNKLLEALQSTAKKLQNNQLPDLVDLYGGFKYDQASKLIIHPHGSIIQLTKKESLFLELLLNYKRQLVSYDRIENTIWPDSSMSKDALRTLVRGIRKKTHPDLISNHNAVGYKINLP